MEPHPAQPLNLQSRTRADSIHKTEPSPEVWCLLLTSYYSPGNTTQNLSPPAGAPIPPPGPVSHSTSCQVSARALHVSFLHPRGTCGAHTQQTREAASHQHV